MDKSSVIFTIMSLQKGIWYYYYHDNTWVEDLYMAKEFKSFDDAEQFIKYRFEKSHWGGFFKIERYYVQR